MRKFSIRHIFGVTAMAAGILTGHSAGLTFSGNALPPVEVRPEANTGLDMVYVLDGLSGVSASVSYSGAAPKWFRYSNLGGGYAEEITAGVTNTGSVSTLSQLEPDMGYIVESGGRNSCFYVIDYSRHQLEVTSVYAPENLDCGSTIVELTGTGDAIRYYTINGQQRTLSRELLLTWNTLEWDEESDSFIQVEAHKTLDYLTVETGCTPPAYCNTAFTLTGDRFLQAWGRGLSVSSPAFNPNAVDVHTSARQIYSYDPDDENYTSNSVVDNKEALGGSAPAEIEFSAKGTDAMIHSEWQFARDANFDYIINRVTGEEITYTFRDEGTQYVRFVGSNADGSCEAYGETYEVAIGSSLLKCPNAFSPGASEGVNDEWKVAYRSLTEFKCWIFDRYGTQMCYFDNPEHGWDGRYRGKLVKPGVYYYVIQARGADGKEYKKSGDINIIRYKSKSNSPAATPQE